MKRIIITIYQQEGQVYSMLGLAQQSTGLPYCRSYKISCELGVCEPYNNFCK